MVCQVRNRISRRLSVSKAHGPLKALVGKAEIPEEDCHVFVFALNRALKEISGYSRNPNVDESSPEKKVGKFVRFLRPVL